MSAPHWGMIQDGGAFESLMHAILYAENPGTILFGRPGKDAGQDARSADGSIVYQAKYRQGMTMDRTMALALEELEKIKKYRKPEHTNHRHWQNARRWILVANFSTNPNDITRWQTEVVPVFQAEGLSAEYWSIEELEGKLNTHGHIQDVFFGGENRVLVGLKEAHDLLSAGCIGSDSLEKPMIGREAELQAIRDFAESAAKRFLPVVGPGQIGKSRLLFESLVALADEGWRVFWALPGTMARSSRWFHLLNGNQPTCVAIDDPDDPELLRAVIEQLAAVERRNWKVIVACRSHNSKMLRLYSGNQLVQKPLTLHALDEGQAKKLLRANLATSREEHFLHSVCTHMGNIPGWLCLTAELINKGVPHQLPERADQVATIYIDSCLDSLGPNIRGNGKSMLRWLALWGELTLEANTGEQTELNFLETQGIPEKMTRQLLKSLVGTSLVRNWGIDKRMYAVESRILQECILSEWLLEEIDESFHISAEGRELVNSLAKNKIPSAEKVLRALSHLTYWRLNEPEGFSFLKPVFDAMTTLARDGSAMDQLNIVELVEQAGSADPEKALETLTAIRQHKKDNAEVHVPLWGTETFTHASVVSKLPWVLFQIAEYVANAEVARRYLAEFRELFSLECESSEPLELGESTQNLVERLLCRSKNWKVFAQPARDIVSAEIETPESWPFVNQLLKSLLNPERELTQRVSSWEISWVTWALPPDNPEWGKILDLRQQLFETLRASPSPTLRSQLWHSLAESHHQFHPIVLHGRIKNESTPAYRSVLVEDLETCLAILEAPPIIPTIEEATHARAMWAWYLGYGREDDLIELARRCEHIYSQLSKWRLHVFFRFEEDEESASAAECISDILRDAPSMALFEEFFNDAQCYLSAARLSGEDAADYFPISKLSEVLADLFTPADPTNALTSYVLALLDQIDTKKDLAWHFTIRLCQIHLRRTKEDGNDAAIGEELRRLLVLTKTKGKLLCRLYSYPHPDLIGELTDTELDCVLEHEGEFTDRDFFSLLGAFALVRWDAIQSRLRNHLEVLAGQPLEASESFACFIRSFNMSISWHQSPPEQVPMAWLIGIIMEFGLNGELLKWHYLTQLKKKAGFKFTMPQLVEFIQSRMQVEQQPKPDRSFKALPYDFPITKWCSFDAAIPEEKNAFHDFCQLSLRPGFIALHWLPKFVAQLDPSGAHVVTFVEQYLHDNPNLPADTLARLSYLASAYPDTSEAWASVARPICLKAQGLGREDREHVYFGLTRKETGGMTSAPGEVPGYFYQKREDAVQMRDSEPPDSPLKSYREWALRGAEAELRHQEGWAEERTND